MTTAIQSNATHVFVRIDGRDWALGNELRPRAPAKPTTPTRGVSPVTRPDCREQLRDWLPSADPRAAGYLAFPARCELRAVCRVCRDAQDGGAAVSHFG